MKHDHDVISIAAMGSRKTLTFWMHLLFHKGGVQMVVTPLNLVGTVNVDYPMSMSSTVVAILAENATKKNFKVKTLLHSIRRQKSIVYLYDIEEGKYNVVYTNAKMLNKVWCHFDK